jgi:hypothetical protein
MRVARAPGTVKPGAVVSRAGCQWFTPIILATWEAKIRRIAVQSQPQTVQGLNPILKKPITKRAKRVAQTVRTPA